MTAPCASEIGAIVNRRTCSPSTQQLDVVRLEQPLDMLVAIAREPDGDLVLAVDRKRVRDQRAAARSDRKAVEVSSCVISGLMRTVEPPTDRLGRPTASWLIFSAADT